MNLRLALRLAWRYLLGKRSANAVPILSRISMVAVAVGCGALLILFSVFNGFNALIDQFYTAFYSDLRIRPAQGKFFVPDARRLEATRHVPGILQVTSVLEDNALANSDNDQMVVTLRGVDRNYNRVYDLSRYIQYGTDSVSGDALPTALAGLGVASRLGLSVENAFSRLRLHYPDAQRTGTATELAGAFRSLELKPDGIFMVESEFDDRYVLAALPLVQELFGASGKLSSLELKLDPERAQHAQTALSRIWGADFLVEDRYRQNSSFYAVMSGEKWGVYFILLLVLLIASFNLVGALSMLVLEKQKDMAILTAMGMDARTIRLVFLLESVLWSLVGGVLGLAAGALICLGQQHFGWVKLDGSFLITAYPVRLMARDFGLVFATALGLGLMAGWMPAFKAGRSTMPGLR